MRIQHIEKKDSVEKVIENNEHKEELQKNPHEYIII